MNMKNGSQEKDGDVKDLKNDTVNESSKYNRTLLISFLLFVSYVFVTVASTTDLQLLIPDSKVKLPIINVDLPLFGFYILAPLLIVILHYNLLFNLLQHYKRLDKWKGMDKDILQLSPFLFNYTVQFRVKNINYYLLIIIIWLTIYFLPPLLLFFVQLKFSKYHSLMMTFWHLLIIAIDFFLIFLYWYRINNADLLGEKYDSFKNILFFHKKMGLLQQLKKQVLIFLLLIISLTNFIIIILLKLDNPYLVSIRYSSIGFIIPHLNLEEIILVTSPPSDEIIQRYLAMGKDKQDAWFDFAIGLNLQKRDLRFANFYRCNLLKANFRDSHLQNANLENTILQYANLQDANLQMANLENSQLQKANLENSQLQGANLGFAQLQEAKLMKAQLKKARLWNAQLQSANLNNAQLPEVLLSDANLKMAILSDANLQEAMLTNAKLQKAILWNTQLQGANLNDAQLQGANLVFAQLKGSNLWKAQLQGTNFSHSTLSGANLMGANLQGANFEKANLSGANLMDANLQGANFEKANLQGANLRFAEISGVNLGEIDLRGVDFSDSNLHGILFVKKNFNEPGNITFQNLQSDFKKFIEIRQQLSCQDKYSAKGMLNQFIIDTETTKKVQEAIIEYMKSNCQDIIPDS